MSLISRFFGFSVVGACALIVVEPLSSQNKKASAKPKPNSKAKTDSNETFSRIQEFSSENFYIRTDLSSDDANQLLEKLEKMLFLVAKYYGKTNSQTIEMNIVNNVKNWPAGSIPAYALQWIRNDGGITISSTLSQQDEAGNRQIASAKSIVWAISQRGVPQHEAVHAYCHQNFGRTGPTWYSEGMAELGQYWREDDVGIRIHPEVMGYLKNSKPKSLLEITATSQKTGDSWRNYAWRWALCHLLSTNPNYSARFKPLGMAFLSGQDTSFQAVYGSMSKEISFEYLFFLKHMDQGFHSELCAWDWKTKPQRLKNSGTSQAKIEANRGWQSARVMVKAGDKISISASGEWSLTKDGTSLGPDGDKQGRGRLVGILFDDYELSAPFDLGADCEYEAKSDGSLFLRCQDDWCQIADNIGTVTVKFKSIR